MRHHSPGNAQAMEVFFDDESHFCGTLVIAGIVAEGDNDFLVILLRGAQQNHPVDEVCFLQTPDVVWRNLFFGAEKAQVD